MEKMDIWNFKIKDIELSFTKKRIIFGIIFFVIFAIVLGFGFSSFISEEGYFLAGPFVTSLILLVVGSFLLPAKVTTTPKFSRKLTIGAFIFSIVMSYIIVELLNRNYLFTIHPRATTTKLHNYTNASFGIFNNN
ncbi:MAG: hypothetical protein FWC79_00595 [Oscillospiraceae bacterium]|nr:hypothetical protein [Oscillospiraceae bacterium]